MSACPYPARSSSPMAGPRRSLPGTTPRIPKRDPDWKRPPRRRVLAIRDRLREIYGQPVNEPHGHPIAELVRGVLSQNTNDHNRDVAYARLRERFPTWEAVRDAPTEEVEAAIKPGGLSPTKAPRIQEILGQPRRPPRPRLARRSSARRGARLPHRPPGRGTKDRRRGPAVHLRAPGDPGRRARQAGRRATRPVQARTRPSRRRTTRCSRSPHPRTPTSSTST